MCLFWQKKWQKIAQKHTFLQKHLQYITIVVKYIVPDYALKTVVVQIHSNATPTNHKNSLHPLQREANMNNQTSMAIKQLLQRFKRSANRLVAMFKIVVVSAFLALMLVVSNYVQIKDVVLSLLDEEIIVSIKNAVNLLYGSTSVLFALEQTACFVALPAIAIIFRSVCNFAFVKYIFWLIHCVASKRCTRANVAHNQVHSQREILANSSNKYLTLCKYIS